MGRPFAFGVIMDILFDHQIFSSQKYGGISRYFNELIIGLNHEKDINAQVSLLFSNNHYINDNHFVKYYNFLSNAEFRGKVKLMTKLNEMYFISKLKKKYDIFHPTYYNPYFLKYLKNKPFVLTVHDMIHEKFNIMFSKSDKTSEQKKFLAKKSSKIIAVSNNTKKDLIELFDIKDSKIEVVYLGNSLLQNSISCTGFNVLIPSKYILFVGGRKGYKNFENFIKSIITILKNDLNIYVVCIGGGTFNNYEIEMLKSLGVINKILQYDVKDEDLSYFYRNASAFVFPSLYEGFGIPILEAFACNCPVLCSNTSSFPEIAGEGALYFDPYSTESIKNAINNILNNVEDIRYKLIENGRRRLELFSWSKMTLQTRNVYESILS
jgi:glycosyltransferase involved in cell wall biosynthesis